MSTSEISSIEHQKSETAAISNTVNLVGSCVPGNGIICLSDAEKYSLVQKYENWAGKCAFFIPASGSGSRMFAELVRFVESGEATSLIVDFFKRLPGMALFNELPLVIRQKYETLQPIYIAEYLISSDGMRFQDKPKGLIPFHLSEDHCLNAFQDQLQQALSLLGSNDKVHFSIQKEYESAIYESLKSLNINELSSKVSFSYQDADTDAFCFDENGELVLDGQVPLRRPAGHGALLKNLNSIDSDLIFIKNIDNVQHPTKSGLNEKVWKYCAGLLLQFKSDLSDLMAAFDTNSLKSFNDRYQVFSNQELDNLDIDKLKKYACRPSRVCGMVLNEGAPGGGPFWIDDDGIISKQIVEKVQISDNDAAIVEASSHFNPVFIALSKSDVNGNELNLETFVDSSKFLLVNKPLGSGQIRYRELPGLWNGSMHYWNTVFVEIPKEVFSPVKTVFDLMKDPHISAV